MCTAKGQKARNKNGLEGKEKCKYFGEKKCNIV